LIIAGDDLTVKIIDKEKWWAYGMIYTYENCIFCVP
jgi:hypothetical protein